MCVSNTMKSDQKLNKTKVLQVWKHHRMNKRVMNKDAFVQTYFLLTDIYGLIDGCFQFQEREVVNYKAH